MATSAVIKPSQVGKKAATVQSVADALRLLEVLGRGGSNLSTLVRQTGFTLNRTFRLLATLETAGYVIRESDKRYHLGPKLHLLAQHTDWTRDLVAAAAPELDALASLSGETVLLSVPVGTQRMIVDSRPSRHSLQVSYPVGSSIPLYVGGMGVAILAFADDTLLNRTLDEPRHAFTTKTLVDKDALHAELAKVREAGVRVSREDYAQGEFSVAAAIIDGSSSVRGALTIAGFTARLDEATRAAYISAVRNASKNVSRALGGTF